MTRQIVLVVLVGVVLVGWASNAAAQTPPAEHEIVTADNDVTMRNWGIGLTATGVVAMGVGNAVFFAMRDREGDFAEFGALVYGGSIFCTGGLFTLVGVPLWVAGEIDVEVAEADGRARRASGWSPTVDLGPTSAQLRWKF